MLGGGGEEERGPRGEEGELQELVGGIGHNGQEVGGPGQELGGVAAFRAKPAVRRLQRTVNRST